MALTGGVYAAALTPRRLGTQDINLGAMWDVIDFLCDRRVDGIVLLGSAGEFVHYSSSERMRLMGLAPKRSRVPMLINVSHSTLDGAVELAQAAAASGAAGVLVMPPHFFRYTHDSIREFYLRFAEQASVPVPVLLYNIPQFTNPISLETMECLLRDGSVQGVKDASGDWNVIERLLALRNSQPFSLMVGSDELFSRARTAGVTGAVSGVASAVPELLVALDRSITNGRQDNGDVLQERLRQFLQRIDRLPLPVGIKEAATARGLKLGNHAVPLSQDEQATIAEFRQWFAGWLPAVLEECRHA